MSTAYTLFSSHTACTNLQDRIHDIQADMACGSAADTRCLKLSSPHKTPNSSLSKATQGSISLTCQHARDKSIKLHHIARVAALPVCLCLCLCLCLCPSLPLCSCLCFRTGHTRAHTQAALQRETHAYTGGLCCRTALPPVYACLWL